MEQQHWLEDLRSVKGGANFDKNSELIGASEDGQYIDAHNMRYDINDDDVLSKVGGELILYPAVDNRCNPVGIIDLTGYECIGYRSFYLEEDQGYHQIEFWAKNNSVSLVRIDGIIVLYSKDFPITYDHPLQMDLNLTCAGGEIYITDYNVPPMIFNLLDLMKNSAFANIPNSSCSTKYFSGFIIDEYILQLEESNNHPILIEVTQQPPSNCISIGKGGLYRGLYQYQYRSSTLDGEKTAWSVATPLIPVPLNTGNASAQYPYTKTYGAVNGTSTLYGIHFRLRIENKNNYSYIEFKRTRYTDAGQIGKLGVEKLLDFKYSLTDGQISAVDFFDFDDKSLELDLSTDSNLSQFSSIDAAKTLRYFNSRLYLMNIVFRSRAIESQISFQKTGGKEMFPVIKKMTTPARMDGHKNPYNFAYYRSLMSGEKYGWAVVGWDNFNQPSFAVPVPNFESFQMPNRRDRVSAETLQYSDTPVMAATSDGLDVSPAVDRTHEVFDHYDAVAKGNFNYGHVFTRNAGGYSPFRPVNQNDSNTYSQTDNPNPSVNKGSYSSLDIVTYQPKGFGLNYYSLGMALSGVTVPAQTKSFSIVRTKPANRVIAQGLGYYDLGNPTSISNTKSNGAISFYSPDIDNGLVNFQKVIDNPGRYRVQLVSPLGFFTEICGGVGDDIDDTEALRWTNIDMINYVRILRDGQINTINVGEVAPDVNSDNGEGLYKGDGYGYVGYGKWRTRSHNNAAPAFPNSSNKSGGTDKLFHIAAITTISGAGTNAGARGGSYYRISTVEQMFNYNTVSGGHLLRDLAFDTKECQDFLEPMYIVNIIDTAADVPQGNIQNYIQGGHYQKVEAIIGKVDDAVDQQFLLVDERNEDCTTNDINDPKILFIRSNGVDQAWQDITPYNAFQRNTILNNIQLGIQQVLFNGQPQKIFGVYVHKDTIETNTYTSRTIQFLQATQFGGYPIGFFIPSVDSEIIVKYNTAVPVKAFIGDTQTHEAIFSPFDLTSNNDGSHNPPTTNLAIPFPYVQFFMPSAYKRPYNVGSGGGGEEWTDSNINIINVNDNIEYACEIRQVAAMFTCESRVSLPYEFELNPSDSYSFNKYFPATSYIPRPYKWDGGVSAVNQTDPFDAGYEKDYPQEWVSYWNYGGFRYKPAITFDYSQQEENQTAVSKPKVGFEEVTKFCTGIVWSVKRPPNVINAPAVRTFPALNFFAISDDTGDIKFAYDDLQLDKGNNLYAITHNGVCLLITDKTLLYSATGQQLAAIGNSDSNVILQQLWISKKIGMNDEMWRSAAEGFEILRVARSFNPNASVQTRREDALFFANTDSVYKLSGGSLQDIGRGASYLSRIYNDAIANIGKGYTTPITAVYDILQDEYWLLIKDKLFIYNESKEKFVGDCDYNFDRFVSYNNQTFGVRNLETYTLGDGFIMNGAPVSCHAVIVSAKEVKSAKEFGYQETATNGIKPTKIYYFDDKQNYVANTPSSVIDTVAIPLSVKNYLTMSNYIPRKTLKDSLRQQGRQVIAKIEHVGESAFQIITVNFKFKKLK